MPVLCAILKSDDRAYADGISQEKSIKQKFSVEQDGDCGNAVLSGQTQENHIKQERDNSSGQLGHHFGRPVERCFCCFFGIKTTAGEVKILCRKEKEQDPCHRRDALPDPCCEGSSCDTHMKRHDQDIIQCRIGDTCCNHQSESHTWASCCYEIGLKQSLQDAGRGKRHCNAKIGDRIIEQKIRSTEKPGDRNCKEDADSQKQYAQQSAEQYELGQTLTGSFFVSFPQIFADDSISSGGEHGSDGDGKCDDREYDIERGQCIAPDKTGDEDSIHDGVQRHKGHHDDGRCCEF